MVALTEKEAKARYDHREKEADILGRIITVRMLRPSETTRIIGMTPELAGFEARPPRDGDSSAVLAMSYRWPLMLTANVCDIDGAFIPFPKNRGELDAMYDRLDTEGLFAAGKALNRLYDAVQPLLPTLDEAKNSTGTPISELPVG